MKEINVGMADFGFFLMVALLFIFFAGEPDIQDAIIKYLMK